MTSVNNIPVQHNPIVPRQCGTRHNGAAYVVTDPINSFDTLREFLIRDGNPFPTADLDLCSQGMNPILRPGCDPDDPIYDFYDVVGGDYEWVWDAITEDMALGVSRKFPRDLIGLVDPQGRSMHVKVHDKAIVDGKNIWELKDLQQPLPGDHDSKPEYERRLACGADYPAGSERSNPKYEQGAYVWFPITRFDVIEDPVVQTHNHAVQKLLDLGFDFDLVDN